MTGLVLENLPAFLSGLAALVAAVGHVPQYVRFRDRKLTERIRRAVAEELGTLRTDVHALRERTGALERKVFKARAEPLSAIQGGQP